MKYIHCSWDILEPDSLVPRVPETIITGPNVTEDSKTPRICVAGQMEEVDISDGCEAVNVWDLDSSESLTRARKLAKGIIRSIKEHALPQLSEISDPTNPVSVSIAQYQSYKNF